MKNFIKINRALAAKKKLFLLVLTTLGMLSCIENAPLDSTKGALNGKFSVAANRQVQFSQGNLQYQPSTKTWRFAENQFDTIGIDNTKASDSYSGWIDLFGWGTGNNPAMVSMDDKQYGSYSDWGNNKISNGGNKSKLWRTLAMEEWKYLLFERANASGLISLATVNGVKGCIVLPDDWQLPDELSWSGSAPRYGINQYSLEQWAKMEKAGALFLPAAGLRYGNNYAHGNEAGFYWSSSKDKTDATGAYGAYFDEDENITWYSYPRRFGEAVRLVHDVK